jgi:hypothetical protein
MSVQARELQQIGRGSRLLVRLFEGVSTEIAALPCTGLLMLGKFFQWERVVEKAENGRQTVSDLISGGTDDLLGHFGRSL